MELSVKSRPVDLTTTWTRLHIPTSTGQLNDVSQRCITADGLADAEASQAPRTDHMFSTTVSIKGLQKFLTSYQVGGAAVACKLHAIVVSTELINQVSANDIV